MKDPTRDNELLAFKMSTNIALETHKTAQAVEFYTKVLGFEKVSARESCTEIKANPITLYIQSHQMHEGLVLELFVEDLEKAKQYLLNNGCKIIRWEGPGKDCFVQDPFGVIFNLWKK